MPISVATFLHPKNATHSDPALRNLNYVLEDIYFKGGFMLHLESYQNWLKSLKYHIHHSQQRAMLAVNSEMVLLYWKIGQEILHRQQSEGWGAKVIDQLSRDLTAEFPDMKGFSSRNLKYMRKFAQEWTEFEIVQEVLAQLPWYHQIVFVLFVYNV